MPAPTLLADDRPLARAELRSALDEVPEVRLVGEAELRADLRALAGGLRAELVVVGLDGPGGDALAQVRTLAEALPGTRLLVIGDRDEPRCLLAALRAGAAGYLVRGRLDALPSQLHWLLAGRVALDPALADRLAALTTSPDLHDDEESRLRTERLTPRERDVLAVLTEGLTNAEIAVRLGIGAGTVKLHVEHLIDKLGVANRTQAALLAPPTRPGARPQPAIEPEG